MESFCDYLKDPLLKLASQVSSAEKSAKLIEAIEKGDLEALIANKLLTKEYRVSGMTFKGKKREQNAYEIELIEEAGVQYFNAKKIEQLNKLGYCLATIYQLFNETREQNKYHTKKLEFDDLLRGSYNLFNEDLLRCSLPNPQKDSAPLLDEFQDLSATMGCFQVSHSRTAAGEGLEASLKPQFSLLVIKSNLSMGSRSQWKSWTRL